MTILKDPDFYLASSESYVFRGPCKCWVEGTVVGEVRSDYLLIRLEPSPTDLHTKILLDRILIAGKTESINVLKLPISVYIVKIDDAVVIRTLRCSASNVEVVATGDIFSSYEEAAEFAAGVS